MREKTSPLNPYPHRQQEMHRSSTRRNTNFPWDQLRAQSLRSVCSDLGYKNVLRRAEMIDFLDAVGNGGLDSALESHTASVKPVLTHPRNRTTSTPQSPDSRSESYNPHTRGTRRMRVTDPGPILNTTQRRRVIVSSKVLQSGSPVKKLVVSMMSERNGDVVVGMESDDDVVVVRPRRKRAKLDSAAEEVKIKRPRGRPRKVVVGKKPESSGAPRQVFDGVVLPRRSMVRHYDDGGDLDAEGSIDGEFHGVHLLGSVEQEGSSVDLGAGIGDNAEVSSLGGSNKENEIVVPDNAIGGQLESVPMTL